MARQVMVATAALLFGAPVTGVEQRHFDVPRHQSGDTPQKNVVFILTDDQDITLNSLSKMPKLQAAVTNSGAFFANGFATTPICCPSR